MGERKSAPMKAQVGVAAACREANDGLVEPVEPVEPVPVEPVFGMAS